MRSAGLRQLILDRRILRDGPPLVPSPSFSTAGLARHPPGGGSQRGHSGNAGERRLFNDERRRGRRRRLHRDKDRKDENRTGARLAFTSAGGARVNEPIARLLAFMAAAVARNAGSSSKPDDLGRARLSDLEETQNERDNADNRGSEPDDRMVSQPDRAKGEQYQQPRRQTAQQRRRPQPPENRFHTSSIAPSAGRRNLRSA